MDGWMDRQMESQLPLVIKVKHPGAQMPFQSGSMNLQIKKLCTSQLLAFYGYPTQATCTAMYPPCVCVTQSEIVSSKFLLKLAKGLSRAHLAKNVGKDSCQPFTRL